MADLRSNIHVVSISTFLLIFVVRRALTEEHVVETNNGIIVGTTLYLEAEQDLKKSVSAYLGIPYAQAPIGDLRFKAPIASGVWKGVLNTTRVGNRCPQVPVVRIPRI